MSLDDPSAIDQLVADVLGVDPDEFEDDDVFGEDLPAESLDYVEIAELVDVEFGVTIPDEDLEAIETVGDVKAYVEEHG